MRVLFSLRQFFKEVFRRAKFEEEMDREIRFHLEMESNENERRGSTDMNAKRAALVAFGGIEQVKEEIRSSRSDYLLDEIRKDFAYGFRMLRKSPGFTITALVTLAIGVAAATIIFSLVHSVLLNPLPYPDPDRLVRLYDTNPSKSIDQTGAASGNIVDWRERSKTMEKISGCYTMGRTLTLESGSEVILTAQVSTDFFPLLGSRPVLGRIFTAEETDRSIYNMALVQIGPEPVVILSYGVWKYKFASDPGIVGKRIIIERLPTRVVGVMPANFAMPDPSVQMWIPWSFKGNRPRDQHFVNAIGRIRPGVTIQQAEEELNRIANQLAQEYPATNAGWNVKLVGLQESIAGNSRSLLLVLLGAVGIVLGIACVNIAILQLSRATIRVREAAVRLALGASKGRIMRQFLIESSILAAVAGAAGMVAAYFAIEIIKQVQPMIPRIQEVQLSLPVLVFSIGITTAAAILSGIAPAFHAARADASSVLHDGARSTSGTAAETVRNLLVVAQIAFTVVLLTAAGLLVRSFIRIQSVNPGFRSSNVLVLPVFLDMNKYPSPEKVRVYYNQLLAELRRLPGVRSAGGATALPTSPLGPDFERPVWAEGTLPSDDLKRLADVRMVTTDYFRTLEIKLISGRTFTEMDRPDSPPVVMINQKLANQIWPGQNPLGRKLVVDYSTSGTYPYEVVGIAGNVRFHGPKSEPRAEIYFPHSQRPYLILNIAVRTENDPRLSIQPVRRVLLQIDPQKPAHSITPLEELAGATIQRERYLMNLFGIFAIGSLSLAFLGIYGVLSYRVRQRYQEIGIRMALGSGANRIVLLILKQGLKLAAAGLMAGLAGSLLLTRLMDTLLFGIKPTDPFTMIAASVLILALSIFACWVPALRAAKINPAVALRAET